jgi:hypothetical protein
LPTIAANAVTSSKILDGEIVNADVSATAAIADTKLATIATAGKVSNSATTATELNTPNTIVLRDGSGNLAAGAITATSFTGPLTGNVTGNVSGNAANVTGTVAIANGGTGATTLTGIVKGNGTSALTTAVAGIDYQAPLSLTTTGSGAATLTGNTLNIPAVSATVSANTITGVVAIANGGTGSATQNFVDLTTAQTVAGAKAFSSNATFNGQSIGKGNATGGENLAVGAGAMNTASTGVRNTAVGNSAMQNYAGTSFDNNTSVGYYNLVNMTTGSGNTSVGAESMMALTTGTSNTSIGNQSLINTTGSNNVGVGKRSGDVNSTGNNNTVIGTDANLGANNLNNASAFGYGAVVNASNKVQLGNSSVTSVSTSGKLTTGAVTYPNTHNSTGGQVLTTDASGVASWSTPSTTATAYSGTLPIANGGTGSATQNFVDLTTTQTVAGNKTFSANVTAPSVTSPIFVSTPQALTYSGTNITWNTVNGSNASVILTQNTTLSFSSTPAAGTYGTLVVTQDATGGRTLTLPSTTNVILGSTSTTTIGLSTAAGAKDILNFYYDGTNCYWNIGQGYGVAATPATTNLASGVTGTLPVANGGTGATTLTGIVKGNGTSALTAAVAGTDYQAPLTLTTTGTGAATLTGTTLNIPAVSSTVNANTLTGTVAIANGGTGLSSTPANGQIDIGNGTGFTRATLTAGTAITITNTAGAITIAAAVRPTTDQATATAGQTSFTLSQTPLNGKVWMFINGVRTNNNAYSISGTTLTYTAANNNSYTLVVGDRIQFDYAY